MSHLAFLGTSCVARGPLPAVARTLAAHPAGPAAPFLVFDSETGQRVDLDLRGTLDEVETRYARETAVGEAPRVGRPRLGVVSREVSLLPRHWDWLNAEPGGASAALRRLVEAARRADDGAQAARQARDAGHKLLWALAGDLPGFEEVGRAWFAGDRAAVAAGVAGWPPDVGALAVEALDRWAQPRTTA